MLGKGAFGDVPLFLDMWLLRVPYPSGPSPVPNLGVVSGAAEVGVLLLHPPLQPLSFRPTRRPAWPLPLLF